METSEETGESSRAEAETSKGKSYCPHYERDTCLIHFKCCDEEEWYPCHKCHNEALALIEDIDGKAQETNEPSVDHSENNYTRASNILEEIEDSSSQAESSSQPKGLQDDGSISCEVQQNKNLLGETSGEPIDNEEARSKETASQLPVDARPAISPEENKKLHLVATAIYGTRLKCTSCGYENQEFSKNCGSCGNSFASYFCGECKLLIEKKVDPYHCYKCGICRGNKTDHFHCDVCNVCMELALKENHKCFANRGHDPCAICLEEVFSGAVVFPCFHMIHNDCAVKLVLSGSHACPMCRNAIFQNDEDEVASEETAQQLPSSQGVTSTLSLIGQKICCFPNFVYKRGKDFFTRKVPERFIEMQNVSAL